MKQATLDARREQALSLQHKICEDRVARALAQLMQQGDVTMIDLGITPTFRFKGQP